MTSTDHREGLERGYKSMKQKGGGRQAVLHCFTCPHLHPGPAVTQPLVQVPTALLRTEQTLFGSHHHIRPIAASAQPLSPSTSTGASPPWTSVVRRSNSAHSLKTSSVHTASGYGYNKPHEAGTGGRRQNPAKCSARHSAWLCSRRARLKTKNQGQARTPNATLTHIDIHDSVCGNAGRRHACLVTSLPGSAPGIRNWRARPWSVASSPPELRVPWFLARRRALWTCERARRVGARC